MRTSTAVPAGAALYQVRFQALVTTMLRTNSAHWSVLLLRLRSCTHGSDGAALLAVARAKLARRKAGVLGPCCGTPAPHTPQVEMSSVRAVPPNALCGPQGRHRTSQSYACRKVSRRRHEAPAPKA